MFSRDLRDLVASGEVTVSIRLWSRPQVKVGGRYQIAGVVIEVDSIEVLPFSAVTEYDLAASGEFDLELRDARPLWADRRRHLGHRVEFHVV